MIVPDIGPLDVQTTMRQLIRDAQEEEQKEQQAGGVVDYTGKHKAARLDQVPGWQLRPGAPKMQLRPEEEDRLALVSPLCWSCLHTLCEHAVLHQRLCCLCESS